MLIYSYEYCYGEELFLDVFINLFYVICELQDYRQRR